MININKLLSKIIDNLYKIPSVEYVAGATSTKTDSKVWHSMSDFTLAESSTYTNIGEFTNYFQAVSGGVKVLKSGYYYINVLNYAGMGTANIPAAFRLHFDNNSDGVENTQGYYSYNNATWQYGFLEWYGYINAGASILPQTQKYGTDTTTTYKPSLRMSVLKMDNA